MKKEGGGGGRRPASAALPLPFLLLCPGDKSAVIFTAQLKNA